MNGREVIAVVIVLAALGTAVFGVVAIAGRLDLSGQVRSVRTTTSREQRRDALRTIRAGQPAAPDQAGLVHEVAAALASHGGPALTSAGLALTCLSLALGPRPTPVVVLAAVAALVNAVVAAVMAQRWRRGRRFLAADRDVGAGGER